MRLNVVRSKNAASLYIIKSYRENGKNTSKIIEKLGTEEELREKLGGKDPYEWGRERAKELTRLEKEGQEPVVLAKYSPSVQISKGETRRVHAGYLFLQKIYSQLGLEKLCKKISQKYKFEYDLHSILSSLLYARILFPASKRETKEVVQSFLEPPSFSLQQLYRALDVIAEESEFIQETLYKNSRTVSQRNTGLLYYDCTNYFFETETEEGLKQYGYSKEHRPNPLVQMGLFMDGNGIPLAFSIHPGNQNEQGTLKPLEKKILQDFELSKFVVCTDAGLSSTANRRFNTLGERSFLTTQSVKKLKGFLKAWALDPTGWKLPGGDREYDLREREEDQDPDKTFYKERWIKENDLEQRLIVTFSFKYQRYLRTIRNRQIERAIRMLQQGEARMRKVGPQDVKRFIKQTGVTPEGEIAEKILYELDTERMEKEESYDGFYALCTNLEDPVSSILQINQRRWQIEESFRILKSEFKSRPVYLRRDQRILAHFTTCFMALVLYRILEQRLAGEYTCTQIRDTLSTFDFMPAGSDGWIPLYTRTDLTDRLHDVFGFRTDYEIVSTKRMKKIVKLTKS